MEKDNVAKAKKLWINTDNKLGVREVLASYTHIENSIKVARFIKSKIGVAFYKILKNMGFTDDSMREMILTNKMNTIALLLESGVIDFSKLTELTKEQIDESNKRLVEVTTTE